ncbi:MAG: hypothetical protein ABW221_08655 [Vicinamibacteria bacterium]
MKGYKVRIADGSEIGPMDQQAVRNWYAQGLLESDSPVLAPGATHWVPLAKAIDLVDLRSRRSTSAPVAERKTSDPGFVSYEWSLRIAGALALLAAAGAGFFWWRPALFTPALDMTPWREIALGFLASGLLLAPGWWWTRRLGQLVTLLAACAVAPLAGILVVEGVRGRPLAAMACAALLCAALFALLTARPRPWWKPALAVLAALAAGAGVGYFGLVTPSPLQQQIAAQVLPAARVHDAASGITLSPPDSWRPLPKEQTIAAAPPEARALLAQTRLGGFAYVLSEDAPAGVHSLADHFARARARQQAPGQTTTERDVPTAGGVESRALEAAWTEDGGPRRGLVQAYRNGWTYVTLVAWVVDDGTARSAAALDELARGLSLDASRASRYAQAVEVAVRDVPTLSPDAARLVVARSAHRPLNPAALLAQSFRQQAAGMGALSPDEQRELDVLLATAVAAVEARARPRVLAFVERLRAGTEAEVSSDDESAGLLKSGLLQLTSPQLARLQELAARAIRAGTARA